MDLEPKQERLVPRAKRPGKNTQKTCVNKVKNLLGEGMNNAEVARLTGADKEMVRDMRAKLEDEGKLDVLAFKRRTAARLASFIEKAVARLDSEVDNISPGQLMLPTAIAIDKFVALSEAAPAVQLKAELRISADDINKLLGFGTKVIDADTLPPAQPPEGQA